MEFRFGKYTLSEFALPMDQIVRTLIAAEPRSFVRMSISTDIEDHEKTLGRESVTILWDVNEKAREIEALVVRFQGIAFKFHLDPAADALGVTTQRPYVFDLIGPRRRGRLYFGWPAKVLGTYAFFRLKGDAPTAIGD